MFDIGWTELALIGGVAVVVIGPQDMPRVLHTAGKFVRKIRIFISEIQKSIEKITQDVELDDIARAANEPGGPNLQFEIDRQIAVEDAAREETGGDAHVRK